MKFSRPNSLTEPEPNGNTKGPDYSRLPGAKICGRCGRRLDGSSCLRCSVSGFLWVAIPLTIGFGVFYWAVKEEKIVLVQPMTLTSGEEPQPNSTDVVLLVGACLSSLFVFWSLLIIWNSRRRPRG